MKTTKKLSKKEFEAILSQLRLIAPHIRANVGKLVHHIYWLEKQVSELEVRVRELSQSHFFKKKEELISPAQVTSQPKEYYSLQTRLKTLFDSGEYGSDNWKRHLKYNSLSDETALKLAKGDQDDGKKP